MKLVSFFAKMIGKQMRKGKDHVFDFYDSADQSLSIVTHSVENCDPIHSPGWGDTDPSSRLIVEVVYDNSTNLFTGQYRFCTEPTGNVNKIDGDKCLDGNFWGSSRWLWGNDLIGKSETTFISFAYVGVIDASIATENWSSLQTISPVLPPMSG